MQYSLSHLVLDCFAAVGSKFPPKTRLLHIFHFSFVVLYFLILYNLVHAAFGRNKRLIISLAR